jgi:hypothetical protein
MSEDALCPHCQRPGIVIGSRRYFSRGWPASCRDCGALSYDRPHGIVICLRFIFELFAVPLLVLVWILFPGTFKIFALSAILILVIYGWRQRGRPRPRSTPTFRPVSAESSRLSRRLTYVAILVALLTAAALLALAVRLR